MVDLATTFEENAMEAAAMVWRCERTPLALRKAVGLAAHKARGIVVSEPEFLGDTLLAGLRGLAGVIARPDDDQLATADAGVSEAFAGVASTGSVWVVLGRVAEGRRAETQPGVHYRPQCDGGHGAVSAWGARAASSAGSFARVRHGGNRTETGGEGREG